MKPFAQELSAAERAALAQHIAGRGFSQQAAAVTSAPDGRCTEGGRDVVWPMEEPGWNGWGPGRQRVDVAELAGGRGDAVLALGAPVQHEVVRPNLVGAGRQL